MPPKSSNKKQSVTSWFHCEKCDVYITAKAQGNHENVCPVNGEQSSLEVSSDYVRKGILYTSELCRRTFAIEELNDLASKFVNNLIFISEGAIRLASFHIGEHVEISHNVIPPIVRVIWPVPEKFLTTVFVTTEDYDTNWQKLKGGCFRIRKIPAGAIRPAQVMRLHLKDSDGLQTLNNMQLTDATRLLKLEMKDLVYTCGNKITFSFFNKKLRLEVLSNDTKIGNTSETETQLEDAFDNLSLSSAKCQKFFKVVSSTRLEIQQDILETPTEQETISKFNPITKTDIGGLDQQIQIVEDFMSLALGFKKSVKGARISRGILLYGLSGCGKTMLCESMCTTTRQLCPSTQIINLNSSQIFSKFLGETEKNLTAHLEKAYAHYPNPTLIVIEDVHNLCSKEESNDILKRVAVAFASMMDTLNQRIEGQRVFVLATTSEIDLVNPSVRRCGRFDAEVEIGPPTPKDRAAILCRILRKVENDLTEEQINEIANITHGFVGADLVHLVSHATLAVQKAARTLLDRSDLNGALTFVKPSAMREVLIENPNVHWTDIGGQSELKQQLKQSIEWPLLYPEKFKRLGIKPPRGILMYGPPGCSKTMIAKALATDSQLNFLSIKGPELFSMWVGESERAVREVFRKARQVAPAIVFFDEIDAIGGERTESGGNAGGSSVQERVLTQLLTELDGVETLQNVTIVAATNRPDMIDKALLRPGRIDRIVYVGLPDEAARREIFRIKLAAMPLYEDVDIEHLVVSTKGYTGAEIQAVCHEAALKTLEENLDAEHVRKRHFTYALESVQPRSSTELLRLYEDYAKRH